MLSLEEAMRSLRITAVLFFLICWLGASTVAQQKATTDAFNTYVAAAEQRVLQARAKGSSFLGMDASPTAQREKMMSRLRSGEVVIEKQGSTPSNVAGGLIHDWIGAVLIPKVTVAQVLALVQDYDHSSRNYSPDVMDSRLVSHTGDDFKVFLRLKKHKVITVVLDTEYDVHYARLDPGHQFSMSRSTRVSEIADPGTPDERTLPAGKDHVFMWRLNS